MQSELLDHYVTYLRAERNAAAKTVDAYANDVKRYLEELARRRLEVDAVRREDVLEHLASLARDGLSPRSRGRHLAALRGFHAFLLDEKLVRQNPTEDLDTPKISRKLPVYLSVAEVEALLAAPKDSTVTGARDKAMIEVLYATGLRVSELVGLSLNDLNLVDGYLLTMGKGRRSGWCPWASTPSRRSSATSRARAR